MRIPFPKALSFVLLATTILLLAAKQSAETGPVLMEWRVGDTIRKALVYIPVNAKPNPTPVIFDFHGHGGTMQAVYKSHAFEKLWPDAIYICPQGLNTPGQLTDPDGKRAGWQSRSGILGDRDLKFFDEMLKTLQKDYKVDNKRIYATGHSNGGGFTYLLWAARSDIFAAVAPSSSSSRVIAQLKPKPMLHIMGEKDPLVKPEWQKITIAQVMKLNQCEADGKEIGQYLKHYSSKSGNDVELYVHPGGHTFPTGATVAIVNFFKQQVKK